VNSLRRLGPFLAPYRARLAIAGVFLLIAALATLSMPPLLRDVIDRGFKDAAAQGDSGALLRTLAMLAVAAGVMSAAAAARFTMVSWLGERVVTDLRGAVWRNVLAQPPQFFETLKTGEVLSRLTTDTTVIQTLIGSSISMGLRHAVLLAGSVVMMLVTAPTLTSIVLLTMGAVVLVMMRFSRRVRRLSRSSQDRVADLSSLAGEVLGAIGTVQVSGRQQDEAARFAARAEEAFAAGMRRTRTRAFLMLFVMLVFVGGLLWGAWVGGVAAIEGRTTVGTLTQYLFYAVMAGGGASVLSEVWGDLQRAAGASERLIELLEAEPAIADPAEPRPAPAVPRLAVARPVEPRGAGDPRPAEPRAAEARPADASRERGGLSVGFEGVAFAYPSRPERRVLDGLDLQVRAGERVALVGHSGAGKSTVFALLQRFYEPQAGRVLAGGVPVDAMRLAELRALLAVVPQDAAIFSGDAAFNIRYARPDASDEQVLAAARAAHADEFLRTLPQGYQTELGERGVRLSGGQRQRIAIARALLRDAPILLLDEATSALDAESESLVQDALSTAMRGRTTLVIAHRLATIRDADRVVVMQQGRVAETGTHESLLAQAGIYARLSQLQSLAM
jgi:ATP-binding cassette subfamily B protein